MRWLAVFALAVGAAAGAGQTAGQTADQIAGQTSSGAHTAETVLAAETASSAAEAALPDAPSEVQAQQQSVVAISKQSFSTSGLALRPCRISHQKNQPSLEFEDPTFEAAKKLCIDRTNPYDRFLNTTMRIPMTPNQKAYLAFRNLTDPFNVATIVATSAFTIGTDSHTAFGPGWKGVGWLSGITYVQDATGEFFGTWLIPALAREDPHYHRMPEATVPHRVLHAISRTAIAQHDDGTPMPNYSTIFFYPITSEIANLYVPGVQTNATATTARILTGYATDPIANLITEFLPDLAKRVHVRIIFVQRILNQVATGQPGTE